MLRDPATAAGIGQFAAIQTVAPMGFELSVAGLQAYGEIELRGDLTPAIDPNRSRALTAQRPGNTMEDDAPTLPFVVSDTGTPIIVPQAARELLEDKARE